MARRFTVIKYARMLLGLTQEELARAIGRSRSLVSLVENRRYALSPELQAEVVSFFERYWADATIDKLFDRETGLAKEMR
ncbi:helix-turn-helix transcriptional regulator [Ammonifex thiophilus]|uniref:Helix-turn-helix domain-containing protein n=1 Tax=Ammonifex thiophilus TaxID=444093 RepID=A0A3D8P6B7_9THEO|nr:helix-turn-helix domain-containing protein [Ammonifex thiophilus]